MRKAFMGGRLKRFREERGLTQLALAQALDLSASYVNQLEKNQRPLTVPLLLRINATFGVDVQLFSEDGEARLLADLKDVFADPILTERAAPSELREIVADMPSIGHALVSLHRRYRDAAERVDAMVAALGLGEDGAPSSTSLQPHERVRDFFYAHHNYFPELDEAAEMLFSTATLTVGEMAAGLVDYLRGRHGVTVVFDADPQGDGSDPRQRLYRPEDRLLRLSVRLDSGQRAFQMATQLAFLEMGEAIERLARDAAGEEEETYRLARIGLANHFAGALLMPYGLFLSSAEELRYDIERLGDRFGVGFETVCHRLSTLQRGDARGVPFFFVRVDRAGNISKRQSATDFHFSRVGGSCPLWNVYEAFARPDVVSTQLARMPDGRAYLWVARTVSHGSGGYGAPRKTFAIGLGCDIRHASRLVYSKGLDLSDPEAATPIGVGCKVCERPSCPQRAFPNIGQRLAIDENERRFAPYPVK